MMNKLSFKKYLTESIVDIPRDTLDPTVFSFPSEGQPRLQSSIKKQIQTDVAHIDNIVPVRNFYLIGSILTKRYDSNSDIDVNVEIDTLGMEEDLSSSAILRLVKKLNGKLASGTTHPINYYVIQHEYDLDKTDAAYDLINDKWLKIDETSIEDDELKKHMETFQNSISKLDMITGELRRDVQDVEFYKRLPSHMIHKLKSRMDAKLEEIEDDIIQLSVSKDAVADLRKIAFEKQLDPKEIAHYSSRNWLPENVTYKLLSKYHYMDFIGKLKKYLESKKSLEPKDTRAIKQIGQEMWK